MNTVTAADATGMPAEETEQSGSHRPGKIVVGVDGSGCSAQALRWAARQAHLTGARLHVVTAWQYLSNYGYFAVQDDVDWAGNAREILDETVKMALDVQAAEAVHPYVLQGAPARALLDVAADADLLVVGSRGHGGFTGLLLGSVSQHVASHATCPVVVVHGQVE